MDNLNPEKIIIDYLSFVIPTKNDSRVIDGILYIKNFAEINNIDYEIIVCGEINHDIPVVSRLKTIHVVPAKKGKCIREGIFNSDGNLLIICDADTPVSHVDMLNLLISAKDNEIVIGNRYVNKNTRIYKNTFRHIASRFFSFLVKKIFSINYDTQCGFKIFKSVAAKDIFQHQIAKGFVSDVEILLRAKNMNFKIIQKDIEWKQCAGSTINLLYTFIPTIIEILHLTYWNARGKNKININKNRSV